MSISQGSIEMIAERQASNTLKDFADRMAKKLRAKAAQDGIYSNTQTADALKAMADVFESEGWNP